MYESYCIFDIRSCATDDCMNSEVYSTQKLPW